MLFRSEEDSTIFELMQANIIQRPDSLYGKNMVEIKTTDYEPFKVNKKPVKMFFAFEASQNEVISRDILNFFSDVVSYNNLYGEAVHEFRDKYKELEHFKRFYFSKVDSVEDLDKFVNLYKFLDNALDSVIVNLVPASAAASDKIRTIIEDNTLQRHKIKKIYPTLIADFSETINKAESSPGTTKTYFLTANDIDNNNVAVDDMYFLEQDNVAPIINTRTPPIPNKAIESVAGLELEGRRQLEKSLRKTTEQTRAGSDPALAITKFIFSNFRQEKDRGTLLVGQSEIDTFRTQLDVYSKGSYAVQSGKNYDVSGELDNILGQESRGIIDIRSNTFSDYTSDGFKITFDDYSVADEFVSDIADTNIYGVREYPTIMQKMSDGTKFFGNQALPKEIKILSSSTDLYGLSPAKNFKVEYVNHNASLSSIGKKTLNKTLFSTSSDRKELFSLSFIVASAGDPVKIHLNSPQITANNAGSFTWNSNKPTSLVQEHDTVVKIGPKNGYNWDGKSLSLLNPGTADRDVQTILINPNNLTYSVAQSSFIKEGSSLNYVYERAPISRSIDENDTAIYCSIDKGIFRDRTDIETEQLSPNSNLNYKNLNVRNSIIKAYSSPTAFGGNFYRNLGEGIGESIHSVPANPYLEIDPVQTQSFVQNYDNGFLIRPSQNNYDQRWVRSSNLVRLSETNNAPYINRNFFSSYTALIGDLINYKPIKETIYSSSDTYMIPYDENTVASITFGNTNVDFAGLNNIVNRKIDTTNRRIDPTDQNYINPTIAGSIPNSKRLHYYLINSNGPFSYSLEATRLNYARSLLQNENYRNSISVNKAENFEIDAAINYQISPVYSKSRRSTAVIREGNEHFAIDYEIFYPSIIEVFNESTNQFNKLPNNLITPILESDKNLIYKTIFGNKSKNLNKFTIKYFDFAEQVFPRAQKKILELTNYEIETNYYIDQNSRKISQTKNSLGRSFSDASTFASYLYNSNFSSWSTETFAITDNGTKARVYDGELMQLNYDSAFTAFPSILSGPFRNGYWKQSYGYRINHKNRNDSSTPTINFRPFISYDDVINTIGAETKGIIAEFRSEVIMENYFQNGCDEISSEPSLFGYDYNQNINKLRGYSSYSDEIFTLKDIHKQIDKF